MRISGTAQDGYNNNSNNIDNLLPGVYSLTITNGNGCTQTETTVGGNPPIVISLNVTNTSSSGTDGSISGDVSGGTPDSYYYGYYDWTGPNGYAYSGYGYDGAAYINNLQTCIYTLIFTDVDSCSQTVSAIVGGTSLQPLTLKGNTTHSDCNASTGTATAIAYGGVPEYSYFWSNGMTGSYITGLAVGTYTCT